jgi:hypothetical protein
MENPDREELQQEMIAQGKTKSITTGSQEIIVTDGGPGTNSIHKIEIVSQL